MPGLAVALIVSVVCNVCLYFARDRIESQVRRKYPRCKFAIQPHYFSCGFDVEKVLDLRDATKQKLRRWFDCGTVVTFVLLLPAAVIMVVAFFVSIRSLSTSWMVSAPESGSTVVTSTSFFENALPNALTLEKGVALIVAIGVSTVVHEFGHALAALTLGCPVLGWGFLFIGITPAAFVEIPTDFVEDVRKARRSLAIMCAGVWHNIVLSTAAFACATLLVPLLLSPAFVVESGVFVGKIAQESPLSGRGGLHHNDKIISLNGSPIRTIEDLYSSLRANQIGICLARDDSPSILSALTIDNCCPANSSSSLCFRRELRSEHRFSCLSVRGAFETASGRFCSLFSDCVRDMDDCWRPVLGAEEERLFQFTVSNGGEPSDKKVFFVGKPNDVFHSVVFEDSDVELRLTARSWVKNFLPASVSSFCACSLSWIAALLRTTASVSLTLAYFNALPCFFTDGARIWSLLLSVCFKKDGSKVPRVVGRILNYFLWGMSCLTVAVVLLTLGKTVP